MGETDLKHKVLAIAEEEGAERASYALKLLQSEGKLSIASTGKDPKSGRLVTHEYHVEGPAAILLTTTAIDLDEELLNRCIVLAVDESREQTRAIHELQRADRTLEGLERRLARQDLLQAPPERAAAAASPPRRQPLRRPAHLPRRHHEDPAGPREVPRRSSTRWRWSTSTSGRSRSASCEAGGSTTSRRRSTTSPWRTASPPRRSGRTLDELPPQTRRLLELVHEWVTLAVRGAGDRAERISL